MTRKLYLLASMAFVATMAFAQGDSAPKDWFHLNAATDNYPGINTQATYEQLLKGKTSETVIVAVIDGGVDPYHEDLKDIMWVNPDEIPGNGIDDDKNGYIDDVHGWNFIGNPNGQNVGADALEVTRLVAKYQKKFKGVDIASLSKKDKKLYDKYKKMEEEIEAEQSKMESMYVNTGVPMVKDAYAKVQKHLGKENFTIEDLNNISSSDESLTQTVTILQSIFSKGDTPESLWEKVKSIDEQLLPRVENYYNPDFDPRHIVGDDYSNQRERYYGNPDIKGPDANHGTHVAGIIAAARDNGIGMDGIADNVRIMGVRCVPNGDERDKDVANAIRYAVDNGATVINMSFGKSYPWNKQVVDEAVKYAVKNDVLLVHAAGNDGKDNDTNDNFPNDGYEKRGWFKPKKAKTWMEIGALNYEMDEHAAASFSNYGDDEVDVFAPGVEIYSTTADNQYDSYPGTSMASPMVAGTAALLRSYFPELSATQVKDIIMESSVKSNAQVIIPGTDEEKTSFANLSVSGGKLNSYNAVQKASKTKGKRKKKFRAQAKSNAKAILAKEKASKA